MKTVIACISFIMIFFSSLAFAASPILNVHTGKKVDFADMIADIKGVQLVFVGEVCDNEGHHRVQLDIIRALDVEGEKLAIGVEMFRRDSQGVLDQWTDDKLGTQKFMDAFDDNWSMWPQYQNFFRYARDNRIRIVGLNITRTLIKQVEEYGFDSLTPEQIGSMDGLSCNVEPSYQDVVRRSLMFTGTPGNPKFIYFCEAQILGDSYMAKTLREFMGKNPEYKVVVLAGNSHCWKHGIPARLLRQMKVTYRVILPEIPGGGRLGRDKITSKDTDYLWLDNGPTAWSYGSD